MNMHQCTRKNMAWGRFSCNFASSGVLANGKNTQTTPEMRLLKTNHLELQPKKQHQVVVPNIFYFHPYLENIPILTNIFQMGWNHQPEHGPWWKLMNTRSFYIPSFHAKWWIPWLFFFWSNMIMTFLQVFGWCTWAIVHSPKIFFKFAE